MQQMSHTPIQIRIPSLSICQVMANSEHYTYDPCDCQKINKKVRSDCQRFRNHKAQCIHTANTHTLSAHTQPQSSHYSCVATY